MQDYRDIEVIKTLLAHDIPVSIAVDANQYDRLAGQDVWTADSYVRPVPNHANTIVGYVDD